MKRRIPLPVAALVVLLLASGLLYVLKQTACVWQEHVSQSVRRADRVHIIPHIVDWKKVAELAGTDNGFVHYKDALRADRATIIESSQIGQLAEALAKAERMNPLSMMPPNNESYYILRVEAEYEKITIHVYGTQVVVNPGSFWQKEYRVSEEITAILEQLLDRGDKRSAEDPGQSGYGGPAFPRGLD